MANQVAIPQSNAVPRPKKFIQPPVKVACLSCRAARTRCDGKPVCTNCSNKGKECFYTKSNRGGPRIPRKRARSPELPQELQSSKTEPKIPRMEYSLPNYTPDAIYTDLVAPMITPGSGLIDLETESNLIFDSIFTEQEIAAATAYTDLSLPPMPSTNEMVRKYDSEGAVLNAYYTFIHIYFPILPPSETTLEPDEPITESSSFQPSSPLSLAISAILALIPHPNDPDSTSEKSMLCRRDQAQLYSQLAMDCLEIESEILTSAVQPSEALSSDPLPSVRQRFHPHCPLEVEEVLAYLILSIYEYAQRGNITKMRNRASQAYDAAIRLSLQSESRDETDECAEARRRAWWMTYVCVLQSSIVSSLPPVITLKWSQFTTKLPSSSDADAWPYFLEAQHTILLCTQFTVSLKKALDSNSDLEPLNLRMATLDEQIDRITGRYSEAPQSKYAESYIASEAFLPGSMRLQAQIKLNSARIKLHRYRAFQDIPIFSKRHCDLARRDPEHQPGDGLNCSCISHTSNVSPQTFDQSYPTTSLTPLSRDSPLTSTSTPDSTASFTQPFADPKSARVCLKAALAISRSFESLPYPLLPTRFLSSTSTTLAPRTMPAFACCAMQSCYALLSLSYKSSAVPHSESTQRAKAELYAGIARVLTALENYSTAFEALGGMTDQVREALEGLKDT